MLEFSTIRNGKVAKIFPWVSRTDISASFAPDKQKRRSDMADIPHDLKQGDPRPLEWFFAVYKIAWGAWLLLPLHTFATAPTTYRYIAILPEWFYGIVWLSLGLAQLYAYYRQWHWVRFYLVCIGGVLWTFYGLALGMGDYRAPGLVLFGVMVAFKALTAAWLMPRKK